MSDLDAAIRAKLSGWLGNVESLRRHGEDLLAFDALVESAAAIEAVLDLHKPRSAGVVNKPHLADCSVCLDVGPEVCSPVGYPCDTIEAIAEKLGVEVDGG